MSAKWYHFIQDSVKVIKTTAENFAMDIRHKPPRGNTYLQVAHVWDAVSYTHLTLPTILRV